MNVTRVTVEFETQSDVPVLIDFWASWCAPCRMLSPTIESLADDMTGKIEVGKINVDEQPELASAFRVSSIPTVNMVKGNQVIMQSIGVKSKQALKSEIEAKIKTA